MLSQQSHYALATFHVLSTVAPYILLFNRCYHYGTFGLYQNSIYCLKDLPPLHSLLSCGRS